MTQIKICGNMKESDVYVLNEALPDYAGFILAQGRKRTLSIERVGELVRILDRRIKSVGVFLNQSPEYILRAVEEAGLDAVQLHGDEDEEFIRLIRNKTGKSVIKAFKIEKEEDVLAAAASCADIILLDSGNGGTGECFDWSLLERIDRPFFLAGGLNPLNVSEAVMKVKPAGVDVSSGVETVASKDRSKIFSFIKAVRG